MAQIENIDQLTLSLSQQLDAFQQFLSADSMDTEDITSTLKMVNTILKNDGQRETVLRIFQVVCESRFLDVHLLTLIQSLPSLLESEVIENANLLHHLLSHVCHRLASFVYKGFSLLTILTGMSSVVKVLERNEPTLAEVLKDLLEECRQKMIMVNVSEEKRCHYTFRKAPNDDEEIPPDQFDQLPLLPSTKDLEWNEKIFLRANKEEGAFRDVNHYLDVQFRLMREDYIRPIRKGIKEYTQLRKFSNNPVQKTDSVRIYHGVQIIGIACQDRVAHLVQFDVTGLGQVRWDSSRRLIFGSLVCLSPDNFSTLYFAVVSSRTVEKLKEGIIQICFENNFEEIINLPPDTVFTMMETLAYFEAYRHVLERLREMKNCLPMSRYVVDCNPSIKAPRYLSSEGKMDLSALLKKGSKHCARQVTILDSQTWPPVEETCLTESQMEAVETALSKEMAIIQGPPGTGKTYIGLKIVKILLDNHRVWTSTEDGRRPILVVSYTNHALDQFLEGILQFCPDGIVRVGGRCKNEHVQTFNLKYMQRNFRSELEGLERLRLHRNGVLQDTIERLGARLDASKRVIISPETLEQVMLAGQFDSLRNNSMRPGSMIEWLSDWILTGHENFTRSDPYHVLEKEVISKIVKGERTRHERNVDPRTLLFLPLAERVQLYRFWLNKAKRSGRFKVTDNEILPDKVLSRVINPEIFHAITGSIKDDLRRCNNYRISSWIGMLDQSALRALVSAKYGEFQSDGQLDPETVMNFPETSRHQLYRLWMHRVLNNCRWHGGMLQFAMHEVLPDNHLIPVMNPRLIAAILHEMDGRLREQSQYLIRYWLGLPILYRNVAHLKTFLQCLDGGHNVMGQEGHLNVEKEAEVIQNERLLDMDDSDEESGYSLSDAINDIEDRPFPPKPGQREHDTEHRGFHVSIDQKHRMSDNIHHLLSTLKPMSEDEARHCVDLWSPYLTTEKRVGLYLFWRQQYQANLRNNLMKAAIEYNSESEELCEAKHKRDKHILSKAKVIGMTTTGAARLGRVLKSVACPIIIMEEAAEILESHVVSSLHMKCQHLIQIGDHKQLKPSPSMYELCRQYKLDLSVFERLINNHLHYTPLLMQHRMQPEISRYVQHVYPSLEDHQSTLGRKHIRGVKENVFFFHHEMEERTSSETGSKSNRYEAEFCVALCHYLLQQEYHPGKITILAAYSGQVCTISDIMKQKMGSIFESKLSDVRVASVDNYQGEENDIIILSLVRNNEEGVAGFLQTDNRICVALSRARNGFYAFGNFSLLANRSKLWENVCRTAEQHGQIGERLTLQCGRHPQAQQVEITSPEDFVKIPYGGCQQPCEMKLNCGHLCSYTCHSYDLDHKTFRCQEKCRQTCKAYGHPCSRVCSAACGACQTMTEKKYPDCGHKVVVECGRTPNPTACKSACTRQRPCGHDCKRCCGECTKKNRHNIKDSKQLENGEEELCHLPCDAILDCGHKCPGSCGACLEGRVHISCSATCSAQLDCGHVCPLTCGSPCLPCRAICNSSCCHSTHEHACGAPPLPCREPCPWTCPHQKCNARCAKPCTPCHKPCEKKLDCGHPCASFCEERCVCRLCEQEIQVLQAESESVDSSTKLMKLHCGHVFNVDHLDAHFEESCRNLRLWDPLRCPLDSCKAIIKDWDCWRYFAMVTSHRNRLKSTKRIVKPAEDMKKQWVSEGLVKSDSVQALIQHMKCNDYDTDDIFLLTNQIKLVKVIEQASFRKMRYSDSKELKILEQIVLDSRRLRAKQQLRELSLAIRRAAYMAMLSEAQLCCCLKSEETRAQLDACQKAVCKEHKLEKNTVTEVNKALELWRYHLCNSGDKTKTMDAFDTIIAILDAPADEHLCDIIERTKLAKLPAPLRPDARHGKEDALSRAKRIAGKLYYVDVYIETDKRRTRFKKIISTKT